MPILQPNGDKAGTSDQHMGNITGFSYTINFTNCDPNRGGTPVSNTEYIVNLNLDYFQDFYSEPVYSSPSDVAADTFDGLVRPQFIIVSVYNDDKNPWLEAKLDAGEIRFEFKDNSGNYPWDAGAYAGTHSTIPDGRALAVDHGYFANSNPYGGNMFLQNVGTTSYDGEDFLAAQMHPGYKSSWTSTNLTWAKKRTFMTMSPAFGAPIDISDGYGGAADEPRYLAMRMLWWDPMGTQWVGTTWEQYGVLVNNNISSTSQLFISPDALSSPIHKGLHLPKMTTSNTGWLPAGNSLIHGNNIFTTSITDKQIFTYNGARNEGYPGTSAQIDILRQHAYNTWNNGMGTNCLQYDLGGNIDGIYKSHMEGSRTGGVLYNTISYSTNMLGMQQAYTGTGTCNDSTFVGNNTGANSMYHLDLDQFYMCTEVCPDIITPGTFPWGEANGNSKFGSNLMMYNSPKCPTASEWINDYIYIAMIPAPTLQGNSTDVTLVQTRSGNPNGYDKLFIDSPTNTANYLNCDTGNSAVITGPAINTGATPTNWRIIEPKSQCVYEIQRHEHIYAVDIFNIQFKRINQSCSASGKIYANFQYTYGPDWASLGPATWSIQLAFKVFDAGNNQTIWLYATIDENTSAGPQATAYVTVSPGSYLLQYVDVGAVISSEYFNETGDVFDSYGQVNYAAYSPNQTKVVSPFTTVFTPTVSGTNVTCFGGMDGTITTNTSSGSGFINPVTVTITPGSNGNGSTTIGPQNSFNFAFLSLEAGLHTLDYTDGNACTHSETFTLTEPSSTLSATSTCTPTGTCIGPNGTISINASGGTGPYSVVYTDPSGNISSTTGTSLIGAINGLWTWAVTDATGCGGVTGSCNVGGPTTNNVSIYYPGTLNPTTAGGTDGVLCFQVLTTAVTSCTSANNPLISWTTTATTGMVTATNNTCGAWFPMPATNCYTGLAAGTVTIYWEFNGCSGTNSITLSDPTTLTATATVNTVTCSSPNIGQIVVSESGGSTLNFDHYEYTMCTDAGMTAGCVGPQLSDTFSNLSAGTYYITVTDWFGTGGTTQGQTSAVLPVTVVSASSGTFTWTTTDAACNGALGNIALTAQSGGTAPFTYLWSNGATTQDITGLSYGSYDVVVTDGAGCTDLTSFVIANTSFILSTSKSDQSCNFPASNDGSIQVIVAPYLGTPAPNYTYAWTGPGGYTFTETIAGTTGTLQTGLSVGTYTIVVTDGNSCQATITETIIASADTAENLAITEIPMSCPTGCGELNFTNTTGDFPLWLEISDDAGATWTKVSTASSSAATAFTSIDLAGPLGVQIDNFTYYQENTPNRWCFSMGSTYHARTRGSSSPYCPSVIVPITMSVSAYVPMTHTETIQQPTCCACNSVSCNGAILNVISNGVPIPQGVAGTLMSFDWTLTLDGINIGTQTGSSFTGGVSYTVSSTQGSPTVEEFDTILFTGLYPGTYVFTSTDSCNASVSETWIINDPRVYVTNIITSQPLCAYGCNDGIITVYATGGSSGSYQYSYDDGITWSSVTTSNFYIFGSIGQGTWNIWVRDPICGTQTLFDISDNVLTTDPGCYSDFIPGIWPAGTQTTLTPLSDLNTQWVSLTNNSLPGSSDGSITVDILGGNGPYEVAVSTSANAVGCNLCWLQQTGVINPGLSQYININGASVNNTGITTVASNGALVIDNLSVSLDFSLTALGAWYTIVVKDSTGCFSCTSKYIDNGTLGIIAIYSAEDCNCSCPTGYALIDPVPAGPALPCAGTTPSAPTFISPFNSPNSIQQFGGNNLTSGNYGSSGGRLYIPTGGSASSFAAVSTADTFIKTDLGLVIGFPGQFISAGSGTVLEVALDGGGTPQNYGSIFSSRLWDIGIWPQQSNPNNVIAVPTNEWIGIPIEVSFNSPQTCILGFAADGDYKITLNCGTFLTSEFTLNGGTQTVQVDALNFEEYVLMPILIPKGDHTLTFWVKNNTTNASADQVAGVAFDLFQGDLPSGLSVTSVFVGATTQAQLDPYYILDVFGKKITSRNVTAGTYDHDFLMGDTLGFNCTSGCTIMSMGNITCLSDDTADCTLPINCPEFLSDLVECVGTLSNEVYDRMIAGLLKNKLDVREVWLVVLTKYLIKNLNPCVSMQDLLSWTKFLEDICPDCVNNFEGTKPAIDPNAGTPNGGNGTNTFDF